jgi:hypothetical protein
MDAHFGAGVAARPHGLEPGVEDRIRRQRSRGGARRGGSYATAAFHSVKHETAQLNRQYSGDSAQTQWPPLPQSPPRRSIAPAPTPSHSLVTHEKTASFDDDYDLYADFAPDTVPYGVGMGVTNAQLCAAFGASPIFQTGPAFEDPDSHDAEMEMMKSLSLVDMLRVMQGVEVTQMQTPPACPPAPRLPSGTAPPLPPGASYFALPRPLSSADPPVPRGHEGFTSSVA